MTENQEILFKSALATFPPMMTDDPLVNWKIDNYMCDEIVDYDADLYEAELEVWFASGGTVVSLNGYKRKA